MIGPLDFEIMEVVVQSPPFFHEAISQGGGALPTGLVRRRRALLLRPAAGAADRRLRAERLRRRPERRARRAERHGQHHRAAVVPRLSVRVPDVLQLLPHRGGGAETYIDLLEGGRYRHERIAFSTSRSWIAGAPSIAWHVPAAAWQAAPPRRRPPEPGRKLEPCNSPQSRGRRRALRRCGQITCP